MLTGRKDEETNWPGAAGPGAGKEEPLCVSDMRWLCEKRHIVVETQVVTAGSLNFSETTTDRFHLGAKPSCPGMPNRRYHPEASGLWGTWTDRPPRGLAYMGQGTGDFPSSAQSSHSAPRRLPPDRQGLSHR